jgi:hypothetical protein
MDNKREINFLLYEAGRYHFRKPRLGECARDYGHAIGYHIDCLDYEDSVNFFKDWNRIKHSIKGGPCANSKTT